MTKTKTERQAMPVDEQLAPEVVAFRQQFEHANPLDEIVRQGARNMLQAAIDAEVEAFIQLHSAKTDELGRRLVVKNGSLPEREILTGAGPIPVKQGRVRDNDPNSEQRVTFTPSVLPSYLRKTSTVEELIISKASPPGTSPTP